MSSKEDKKSKGSKSEATSPAPDTPKKKDSVEIASDTKPKSKRQKSQRTVTAPGPVTIDHSGLIDKKHADSTLVVSTSVLSVHRAIISVRNEHILTGPSGKKNKKGGLDYDFKDIEFPILRIVVQWLYSDKIDLPSISLTDVVKVIRAAGHWQMDRLSQLAEHHLQANLSLDNLWDVLSLAHTQKVEKAKQLCMEFAYTHHDAVLSDPRFRKLEVDLIVDEAQLYSKYRAQLEGGWRPPAVEVTAASTMVEDFKNLYDTMSGSDHLIVVEKQQIRCHKAILGHASPKLMELADAKDGSALPKEFKTVTADTFQALLRYLYYGNTDIEPMAATQLISFAKQLGLITLVDICEAKIRHGIDNGTCLSILEVAYHPLLKDREDLQKELKTNCRSYFIDHIREIEVAPLKSMDAAIGADLLLAVQKQIGVSWTISGSADHHHHHNGASSSSNGMTPSSSGTHVSTPSANAHRKKNSRLSSSIEGKKVAATTTSASAADDESGEATPVSTPSSAATAPVAAATAAHSNHVTAGSGSAVGGAVVASTADEESSDDSESKDNKSAAEESSEPAAAAAAASSSTATPAAAASTATASAPVVVAHEEPAATADEDIPVSPKSPKKSPVARSESKREKEDKKDKKDKKKDKEEKKEKDDKKETKDEEKEEKEGKKDKSKDKKDKKEKEKKKASGGLGF